MIEEFINLPWHDAELVSIMMNRDQDTLTISIRWPETYGSKLVSIEFDNCYGMRTDMNFGFFPPDPILEAHCESNSTELDEIKSSWRKMGVDLSNLLCFKIETNTTASIIKVYAKGFQIVNGSQ